jgi:HEAT repeat protein
MSQAKAQSAAALTPLLAGAAESPGQTVPVNTKEEADKLAAVLTSGAGQKEKVDACRGLALIGTKDAVPALASLLADEKLSHMARYGLEPIPDPAVDEALRDALGKLKGRPLVGVIGSIGARRDAKAVEPLAKLLEDPDADVVRTAARALGKIGTPEAAKLLGEKLAGAPATLRRGVADACLACAEAFVAQGKRDEAAAMYEQVAKADLPRHFRVAATHGLIQARQPAGKP